jgi:hypothetical protein
VLHFFSRVDVCYDTCKRSQEPLNLSSATVLLLDVHTSFNIMPYLVSKTRGHSEDWAGDNLMLVSGFSDLVHILYGVMSQKVRSGNSGGQDTSNRQERTQYFSKLVCELLLTCHILYILSHLTIFRVTWFQEPMGICHIFAVRLTLLKRLCKYLASILRHFVYFDVPCLNGLRSS